MAAGSLEPGDLPSSWDTARHFVVCHENLVEVVADDVALENYDQQIDVVAADALRRNLRDHR